MEPESPSAPAGQFPPMFRLELPFSQFLPYFLVPQCDNDFLVKAYFSLVKTYFISGPQLFSCQNLLYFSGQLLLSVGRWRCIESHESL